MAEEFSLSQKKKQTNLTIQLVNRAGPGLTKSNMLTTVYFAAQPILTQR